MVGEHTCRLRKYVGVDTNQQDPETGRVLGWQSMVLLVILSGEADGDRVFFAGHGPHCRDD